MEYRTVVRHFRCTPEESREIEENARKEKKTPSAYVRDAALHRKIPALPAEAMELLEKLTFDELKIGNNINQAVRLCNSKKVVSVDDYRKLTDSLKILMDQRHEMIRLLSGMERR